MAQATFVNQNLLLASSSSPLKFLLLDPKARAVKTIQRKGHWILTMDKFHFSVAFFSEMPGTVRWNSGPC